jgi:glycolate oxidase
MAPHALLEPDEEILNRRPAIVRQLRRIAGADNVIDDEDGRRVFETDALTAYRCMPLAVVLPTSTDQVSRILKYCHGEGIKVIARGAGTSLSGAALPQEDAVVVGVSKMNRVLEVDYDNRFARVQTGVTNLAISDEVAGRGFFYAPDPSSQVACTLAGNIAMNSGGAHCLKYGVTTNNILGVKMVLMTGEVVEIGGDAYDSPAYDLLALVVGSEGQFGVVTEATVRILRSSEGARPMLLGFASSKSAGACVAGIIASGIIPMAIEFMDKPAIKVCDDFAGAGYPRDVEALLIVEVDGSDDEITELLYEIQKIARKYRPKSIRISQSDAESAAIWKGRKSAFGAMGHISDYYCMDGTIPLGKLSDVLVEISRICRGYRLPVANIFHAGDGNLHPLILYDANNAEQAERAEKCGADILKLCVEVGGCLSGEHGIGIEKRDLMPVQFGKADLAQQMRIKTVFDPDWLLNPSKVFPLEARQNS